MQKKCALQKFASALGMIALGTLAALAAGSPLVTQMYDGQQFPPPHDHSPRDRPPRERPLRLDGPALEDLTQVLDLTPDQQKTIREAIETAQKTIDATLTDVQRAKLQQLRERHGSPPPRDISEQDEDHGRPVELVARDLGVTPEQFRAAFRKVRPAPAGQRPTEEQRRANRKVLSAALGVSPEKLDEVMDRYRPGGRGDNGPQDPPPGAPPPPDE